MKEKDKSEKPQEKAPGFGDPFGGEGAEKSTGTVTVGSGVYLEKLPVAGMTVKQIREEYAVDMDIAKDADAFVEGKKADEDTVVLDAQVLRFAHRAGEKGNHESR